AEGCDGVGGSEADSEKGTRARRDGWSAYGTVGCGAGAIQSPAGVVLAPRAWVTSSDHAPLAQREEGGQNLMSGPTSRLLALRLQCPVNRFLRSGQVLTEHTGLDVRGEVVPEGPVVVANLANCGLDRLGDGRSRTLRCRANLAVLAPKPQRRRQLMVEPFDLGLELPDARQIVE